MCLACLPPPARAQEAWDAVFLKGNKIGHVHTFIEKVSEKGRELYRVRVIRCSRSGGSMTR